MLMAVSADGVKRESAVILVALGTVILCISLQHHANVTVPVSIADKAVMREFATWCDLLQKGKILT